MEPARAGFHKIVSDILRRAPVEDAAVIAWGLICGQRVAEKTVALGFRDGVLRVQVPDAAWSANLTAFVPQYIAALNGMLGRRVERIDFILPDQSRTSKSA
ncbi:MAG TPA: DUF721 domain-containing protein [Terriglobales bacterium]|jgi:hypothetical protein|nr:DUF721 domain-containing protein [Terriglobales bacterium]